MDYRDKVIVGIDIQNDFITGVFANPEAHRRLTNIAANITRLMIDGADLVLTQDTHYDDYMLTDEAKRFPAEHCIRGTWGWDLAEFLKPLLRFRNVLVMEKEGFKAPALAEYCLCPGTIYILGFCTDICVKENALALRDTYPGKNIIVLSGCCAGTTREAHEAAILEMEEAGIDVQEFYTDSTVKRLIEINEECPFCGNKIG